MRQPPPDSTQSAPPPTSPPENQSRSFGKAFLHFLGEEKIWWLTPLLLSLLGLVLLVLYRIQTAAPFIYRLD